MIRSDAAAVEAGRMTMEEIPFSLRSAVFSVLKTLCVKAAQNSLDLIYDVDPAIFDQVVGDPLRLRQVITNLIGNAVKFTTKGQVALSCRLLRDVGDAVELEFCVADSGIGIEQNKLDLIFDTFAQADGSTTRKYGGTGLGLSISKRLVNLMNGKLWVESIYGQGSRFYFTTIARKSDRPAERVTEKLLPWANRQVLFIDTLHDKTGVADQLRNLKLKPLVIHSVQDVYKVPMRSDGIPAFDTIIADTLAAVERLREMEHIRYIPIVLLAPIHVPISDDNPSFLDLDESRRQLLALPSTDDSTYRPIPVKACLDMGVTSYYNAPLQLEDLANAILPALESRQLPTGDDGKSGVLNILLAEDNLVNQKLACKLLEVAGHKIDVADNGQIAFEKYRDACRAGKPYAVILVSGILTCEIILRLTFLPQMDVSMPIVGGLESTSMIRALEEEEKYSRIPIIALTAHAMLGDRERCIAAGMVSQSSDQLWPSAKRPALWQDDFVSKPVRRGDLMSTIAKMLKQ